MASPNKPKDKDIKVTFEDQQKINKFARNNARLQDYKEEVKNKKKELQNVEDAENELLMREDDTEPVPYQIGEVFVSFTTEGAGEMLEKAKANLEEEIKTIENQAEFHKKILQDLKVELYAKFGNEINLEAEDDS
ncbi:prefoldin subunit 4-like [Mytilus californianus]|uniref:prefoldin subunit 4-like n=1 Tax=Mytilus californianus TaxID=6549 RepID=UPI0022477F0D|nr:prefoldin subunit 4-like [Mytilus californianus]